MSSRTPDKPPVVARISLKDALQRVGAAIYGSDWIGKLTERERWLIKRYIEPQHGASSIRPATITYVGPGGPFVPVNDPALAAEVERARDRREQMNDQDDQVLEWLEQQGFNCETASLDLAKFERAFTSAFEVSAVPPMANVGEGPASPSGTRTNKAAAAERECAKWLCGLTERPANKEIAFKAAVSACAIIGPLTQNAFERAWANHAPAEWKVAGARKGGRKSRPP